MDETDQDGENALVTTRNHATFAACILTAVDDVIGDIEWCLAAVMKKSTINEKSLVLEVVVIQKLQKVVNVLSTLAKTSLYGLADQIFRSLVRFFKCFGSVIKQV